jgi:uncharacterized protein YbgA (DUF1722 family)/uncharacterized protein YbbK (DUF523 family)
MTIPGVWSGAEQGYRQMSDQRQCDTQAAKIRVGISACLLGAPVRFDGGHKRDRFIDEQLGRFFEFVPACPEMAIGLGTPRQPIRLVAAEGGVRAVGSRDATLDVTGRLQAYAREAASNSGDLCGYIFKKDSPSCGMQRVRVYDTGGVPRRDGTGLFAEAIMRDRPLLPVEEEGRLNDPVLRENFINRVFVYARWRKLLADGLSKAGLVAFHADHKLLIMAHSTDGYRQLGRLVGNLQARPLPDIADEYIATLMQVLGRRSSRKRHANVLQHLLGYLRKCADPRDRRDLLDAIEAYRRGDYPLVVPVRLLHHQFLRHPHPYVSRQVYLAPYPEALMLRNAV